jgi:integrase/recombinase XerD
MVISCLPWEIAMLEIYYVRPVTIDRIRGSWIAPAIEQYVGWLAQQRFTSRSVRHCIPILVSFGEFAKARGASELGNLSAHVEPFVVVRVRERAGGEAPRGARRLARRCAIPFARCCA